MLDIVSRHSQALANAACVLVVVLMMLSIANTVQFFLEDMSRLEAAAPTGTTGRNTPREQTPRIDIARLNLFGEADAVVEETVVDAPETKLNLELQGVFTAEDETQSGAIVAEGNKDGELFHIGDRLPGNATLSAVMDDHILLKRGSGLEKLMFSDSALRAPSGSSGGVSPGRPTPRAAGGRANASSLQEVRERIRNRSRNMTTGRPASERSGPDSIRNVLSQYQERIQSDPAGLLSELGVAPVAEGDASGYRIGSEVSHRALLQAGLQQGDVILSVNGRSVGDAQRDSALVQQALAAKRVRVEVQRDSRKFYVTVPIP